MRVVLLSAALGWTLAAAVLAEETEVTLPDGVDATLSLPEGAEGDVPAVVMLHGFGSSKDEVGAMYAREAAALAERRPSASAGLSKPAFRVQQRQSWH